VPSKTQCEGLRPDPWTAFRLGPAGRLTGGGRWSAHGGTGCTMGGGHRAGGLQSSIARDWDLVLERVDATPCFHKNLNLPR
jgi:hypothetical protein